MTYKRNRLKVLRVVFSRDPELKTLQSIINKIDSKRKKKGKHYYSYKDLEDIIALTVLCPYRTDEKIFIEWMKRTFHVLTPDKEALRDDPSGHRGYHYIVTLHDDALQSFPEFRDKRCEIQIKTILEEAFDAKTHDLTYKEVEGDVPEQLKSQFAILSRTLKGIDEQSGFLRDLILEEERELRLRRQACVILFLTDRPTKALEKKLSMDLDSIKPEDASKIAQGLKTLASSGISKYLCGFAALCSLKLNDDYLKGEALNYAKRFVENSNGSWESYMVQASIEWALEEFENAINGVSNALRIASKRRDTKLLRAAKNSFIYFATDWKSLKKQNKPEYTSRAARYAKELSSSRSFLKLMDTIGFYKIVFGETTEQIESGRQLIWKSRKRRPKDEAYKYFFRHHEYVALKRLLEKTT